MPFADTVSAKGRGCLDGDQSSFGRRGARQVMGAPIIVRQRV
jgi:hypothetical protein